MFNWYWSAEIIKSRACSVLQIPVQTAAVEQPDRTAPSQARAVEVSNEAIVPRTSTSRVPLPLNYSRQGLVTSQAHWLNSTTKNSEGWRSSCYRNSNGPVWETNWIMLIVPVLTESLDFLDVRFEISYSSSPLLTEWCHQRWASSCER